MKIFRILSFAAFLALACSTSFAETGKHTTEVNFITKDAVSMKCRVILIYEVSPHTKRILGGNEEFGHHLDFQVLTAVNMTSSNLLYQEIIPATGKFNSLVSDRLAQFLEHSGILVKEVSCEAMIAPKLTTVTPTPLVTPLTLIALVAIIAVAALLFIRKKR